MPQHLTIVLNDLQLATLDRYLARSDVSMTREDAVVHAFTKWAVEEGLIDDPVEDNTIDAGRLNSANDI